MQKLGIFVKSLTSDHLSLAVTQCVNTLVKTTNIDPVIFREELSHINRRPLCGVMHVHNAWRYNGICISTDISTTKTLISCACPTRKFFLIWNLEWLYQDNLVYEMMRNVYLSPEVELIARSESHAKIIEKAWRKPKLIVEDLNVTQIQSLFQT